MTLLRESLHALGLDPRCSIAIVNKNGASGNVCLLARCGLRIGVSKSLIVMP